MKFESSKLDSLQRDFKILADKKKAQILARFFKTGDGDYGQGDIFLGITVPQSRQIAKKYNDLKFGDVTVLLKSKYHEERLIALLILVDQFTRGLQIQKKKIFDFYLKNTGYINNWDLVDLTADKIVGAYLFDKQKSILYIRSQNTVDY